MHGLRIVSPFGVLAERVQRVQNCVNLICVQSVVTMTCTAGGMDYFDDCMCPAMTQSSACDANLGSAQVLNIPTKINKGTVEITTNVALIKAGDKVGASEATLLAKLGIKPFSYGLIVKHVSTLHCIF